MYLNLKPLKMNLMYLKNFSFVILCIILSLITSCWASKRSYFVLSDLQLDRVVLHSNNLAKILGKYVSNQDIDILCSKDFNATTFFDSSNKWKTVLKTSYVNYSQALTLSKFNAS